MAQADNFMHIYSFFSASFYASVFAVKCKNRATPVGIALLSPNAIVVSIRRTGVKNDVV